MSMNNSKIAFVLYEGKHDGAILSRLLRVNGYENFSDKKLREFEEPLKGFLESRITKYIYEDELNIWQRPQLPNFICKSKSQDKWYVFYEMGGDSQVTKTKEFIKMLAQPVSDFENDNKFETANKYSLAFFYDSDSNIIVRKKQFKNDYKNELTDFTKRIEENEDSSFIGNECDGFQNIGLYIYGKEEGTGTLEDIVIPAMKKGNEIIFEDADIFLEKYMPNEDKQKRSKKGKALIGVVGQPKHQGKANNVIISDTSFLNKSKFDADTVFTEILAFILQL